MIPVIHLVEDLKTGGLEKVIAAIALNIDKSKYNVSVWCVAHGGAIADELVKKGVHVEVLGITSYFNPLNILKLAGRLREARPSIIHTHGYFAGTIGRIAGLLAGTPVFFHHVHSTYFGYSKRNVVIERVLGLFTHKVLCCSQSAANYVRESGYVPLAKIHVLYNGCPPHKTGGKDPGALRAGLGIGPGDRVVVTVASLVENKGHKYLIEAIGKIAAEFPRVKLLIIGDGIARKQLEQQVSGLCIAPHVAFAGARSDIPDILAIAELFVLASCYREGLGISIIEAMAAEKAAIGTEVGGIVEVIAHGRTGLIVPPFDSNALAAAIKELLSNPDQTKEFGKNGLQRYREVFTEKKMVRELEIHYDRAIVK